MKARMDAAAGPLVLARHDLARGRPDEALAALERATGPELESEQFWSLRTRALYQLRRWDDAIETAQTGLELNPDDFELLDLLALGQLERGKKKRALATIDAAIALYPENAVLHAHRGLILARAARRSFRLASFKKARAAVEDALRLDPDCEAAHRVRAQIALLSRDRGATEYGSELLSLDPDDERAHAVAGVAHAHRGDIAGAARHYVEAARLNPSNPSMAWLGRRGRAWQGWFAAPMRLAHRLSRGRFRIVWVFVVLVSLGLHQPWLTAAVVVFWCYTWAVSLYLRTRAGKAPE
jgi:tetratricopeptide (TPR) repeat protein